MKKIDKAEKVYGVFQSIAEEYDMMNEVISLKRHQSWKKNLIDNSNITSECVVADLCCGTGDIAFMLAKTGAKRIIGMDFSENMLEVAKKRKAAFNIEQVEFIHGDVSALPLDDESIDRVTISFGLRNVVNYEKVVQECYRVLKKGGQLSILEASYPNSKWVRPFFKLYFKHIMPFMGRFFVKKMAEYQWLHDSTEDFLTKIELKQLLEKVGFDDVYLISLLLGSAAIHIGKKSL